MTGKKSSKSPLRLGSMWGDDKEGKLPLVTKPLMGNAIKCGNVWKEKK